MINKVVKIISTILSLAIVLLIIPFIPNTSTGEIIYVSSVMIISMGNMVIWRKQLF